jgi:hypothetical protein
MSEGIERLGCTSVPEAGSDYLTYLVCRNQPLFGHLCEEGIAVRGCAFWEWLNRVVECRLNSLLDCLFCLSSLDCTWELRKKRILLTPSVVPPL